METSCSYTGGEAWMSSDERKWITKIKELAEKYPDDVEIRRMPENNDGCIYAKIPSSWLKIQPKFHRNLSDEQRVALADRARKMRKGIQ